MHHCGSNLPFFESTDTDCYLLTSLIVNWCTIHTIHNSVEFWLWSPRAGFWQCEHKDQVVLSFTDWSQSIRVFDKAFDRPFWAALNVPMTTRADGTTLSKDCGRYALVCDALVFSGQCLSHWTALNCNRLLGCWRLMGTQGFFLVLLFFLSPVVLLDQER